MLPFDEIARANPEYVDALYREYLRDPTAVDEGWALVFAGFDLALRDGARAGGSVAELVHAYRELGHLVADLDPLGGSPREHPLLRLSELGFSEGDLDRVVDWAPFKGGTRGPLRELIAALRETYCGTLGVEYLSVADKARREWLQERMEPRRNHPELGADERRAMLERLVTAELFEQFLQARYPGQKRFSLEGGEALVPLLDALVEETARLEVAEVVLGMAHRGRLNVLAHVLEKPYEMIFAEFEGAPLPDDILGDGDVKYHLGYSKDRRTRAGAEVHLSLTSNPSHLESVNPVVEGIVRAKQAYREDRDRRRVAPVLLHGDAAFMGQGIVYETLALSPLPAFTTGGTIHVIVNNQIGFTTSPEEYLFTRYPSDPAQVLRAPVFHVNADDPEAAVQAARLAAGYRQTFRPADFTPNPRVKKLLDDRHARIARGEALDWGAAESLAYGSLLLEGTPVRVSGQDTVRGTFGHRHAAIFDAKDGRPWVPLNHVQDGQALLEAVNSPLSEQAVLGFEYGMSSGDPRRLMVWEAQFGDFVNSAQVIIDQFIASGESKWQRMSGLVLLLPHGYEGQGSEHSSARLERFLQLCADRNIQVIVPTTPAQIFHALRRQIHRRFRKPLVVMSPKSLLRHPQAVSPLTELTDAGFRLTLDDPRPPSAARRLVMCAGKIFYALDAARREKQRDDVALVRIEQLYPFPTHKVRALVQRHASAREVCWVQEEPANQGAWWFVRPLLSPLLRPDVRFSYIGRT